MAEVRAPVSSSTDVTVIDDLVSTDSTAALSAAQGSILSDRIDALQGSLIPQGNWDASTGDAPTRADLVPVGSGDYFIVDTDGTTSLGGINDWKVNDWIVKTTFSWAKVDNTALQPIVDSLNSSDTTSALSANMGKQLDEDKADKTNVLELDNTTAYTPTEQNHPATAGYVDDVSDRVTTLESANWELVALVQALDAESLVKTEIYDMPETFAALYVEKAANEGFNFIYGKTTTSDTYIHGDITIRRNSLGTSSRFDSTNIESYVMSRNAFSSTHENLLADNMKDYNSAEITLTVNREWDQANGQIARDVAYMYHFRISRGYGGQAAYADRYAVFARREQITVDNTHLFLQAE